MHGYVKVIAFVSALAIPASVNAVGPVSGNVLGSELGFAFGPSLSEHTGEPAPASPPPPQPEQAPATFFTAGFAKPLPPPGHPPGLSAR
jgi:hypothetical protein